jgi:hypothetical protein
LGNYWVLDCTERKVRSSQGSMPANGRGFGLKAHVTESATENVPLEALGNLGQE